MELSQQMIAALCATLCGASPIGQAWGSIDEWRKTSGIIGAQNFEVAVRMATLRTASNAQGVQDGLVICGATTVWLPGIPAKHVFDYIHDRNRRGEWDTFCNGVPAQQEDYVAAVQLPRYTVSVLHPRAAHGTNNKKLILQQVCADESCILVAYAPVEEHSLKEVMHEAGSLASFYLLPSGFVILPDGHGDQQIPPVDTKHPSSAAMIHRNNDGCLVSALFQTFLKGPTPESLVAQTINNVENLVSHSIVKIKDAVHANIVVAA
uniref:Uncharacterized protein n=1 Tax=Avena sativa TaxID=4498 RepID=A0ACD5W7E7_AVESA